MGKCKCELKGMETRNLSLDILRLLACIAVITIHTAGSPIVHGMVEQGTWGYASCLVLGALCRWSVPVFAMITGFFMLDSTKSLPLKQLFGKYILRLFVALFFWSFFYAITLHKRLYPLGSQEGHFWYVGMCIGLYLAMPIMRWISTNQKLLGYFCWMWFALMVYKFLGSFWVLPINFCDVIFVDFVGYCLMAYYLKTLSLSKRTRAIVYFMGVLGIAATICGGVVNQDPDTAFFSYTSPNVIMTAAAVFVFFLYSPLHANKRIAQWIGTLSQCTFGVYLVHMWILIQIFFRLHRFIPNVIVLTMVCVIVTFILGSGVVLIIKKVPVLNKYLV